MKAVKYILIAFALIIGLVVFTSVTGIFSSIISAPGRVISKTLETDNIIGSYEWYYDSWKQWEARVAQIQSEQSAMKAAKADGGKFSDIDRYRVELEGIRQSCRDLVAKYNANASKVNHVIFKGRDAPASLDPTSCEQE